MVVVVVGGGRWRQNGENYFPGIAYFLLYVKILQLQQPFSQDGPKRANPTMATSTVTARRKGDPQHYERSREAITHVQSDFPKKVGLSALGVPLLCFFDTSY